MESNTQSGGGQYGGGGDKAPPEPPKLPPPELLDAATGTVYLPFQDVSYEANCISWRCCHKPADLITDLYGPDNIDQTGYRLTALVPEKLREKGIDQHEYAAMLEDIKFALSAELYTTIPLVGFSCCCQFVMAPPSIEIKATVEKAIAARARVWRDEHGVNTSIIPVQSWFKPPMPNANWSGWGDSGVRAEWSGHTLVFAPPGAQSMSYEEAWNAAPPSTNAQKFALWKLKGPSEYPLIW